MCTSGVVGFNHWSGGSFFHGYPSCGWKRVAGRGDVAVEVSLQRWRIQHLFGYGSIPINTIFRGMNIHLPAILMFTRGARFLPIPIWLYGFLEHFGTQNPNHGPPRYRTCAVLWSHRIQATSGDPCFGTIWKLWEIPYTWHVGNTKKKHLNLVGLGPRSKRCWNC